MRRLIVAVVLLAVSSRGAGAGQMRRSGSPLITPATEAAVPADRLGRLKNWLKSVDRHEPGESDDALAAVSDWRNAELRGLWIDIDVLAQLMRKTGLRRFLVQGDRPGRAIEIRYSPTQLRQLVAFACASAAMFATDPNCLLSRTATDLDDDLLKLAAHAAAERSRTGDNNYTMRRAALLHADIAMLHPLAPVEPFSSTPAKTVGPTSWRIDIADGRGTDSGLSAIHWDIARLALDQIGPGGSMQPAPGRDAMVRAWYRATAAWMQFRESHDTPHLDRGRAIFPDDPNLLFLSGCLHETFATAAIQAAARSVALPAGLTVTLETERGELRQAEAFFRRALASRPDTGEAHLRLGRVLGVLGRHAEAAAELQQALTLVEDDDLRYYGELFAGAEEEALGRFQASREGYERAAALFPLAQSPYLAMSQLAHRRGDRAGAIEAMRKMFTLPEPVAGSRDDPWWRYHVAQARNAEKLLDDVRAPFKRGGL